MHQPLAIREVGLFGNDAVAAAPDLIHVETIGASASLHDWSISAHRHPTLVQLAYVEQGGAWIGTDGTTHQPVLPALVVTPCDCPHAFDFAPGTSGWVLSISVELLDDPRLAAADRDFLRAGTSAAVATLAGAPDRAALIDALFRHIAAREVHSQVPVNAATCASVSLLLALGVEMVQRDDAAGQPVESNRRELFRRFMGLVGKRHREDWSVPRYADALGCSQATLSRVCREFGRRSPAQLIIARRLIEARRLLTFTDASVARIADALGYRDPAYFARNFASGVGVSPAAYRKRHMRRVG
jgi:AraC family transcriptional activator of pobA